MKNLKYILIILCLLSNNKDLFGLSFKTIKESLIIEEQKDVSGYLKEIKILNIHTSNHYELLTYKRKQKNTIRIGSVRKKIKLSNPIR